MVHCSILPVVYLSFIYSITYSNCYNYKNVFSLVSVIIFICFLLTSTTADNCSPLKWRHPFSLSLSRFMKCRTAVRASAVYSRWRQIVLMIERDETSTTTEIKFGAQCREENDASFFMLRDASTSKIVRLMTICLHCYDRRWVAYVNDSRNQSCADHRTDHRS